MVIVSTKGVSNHAAILMTIYALLNARAFKMYVDRDIKKAGGIGATAGINNAKKHHPGWLKKKKKRERRERATECYVSFTNYFPLRLAMQES